VRWRPFPDKTWRGASLFDFPLVHNLERVYNREEPSNTVKRILGEGMPGGSGDKRGI